MKLSRSAAAAIGVAVVAVSALAIAAPASAATPGVTYVHVADLVSNPALGSDTFGYAFVAPTDELTGLRFTAGQPLLRMYAPGTLSNDFGSIVDTTVVGTTALLPQQSSIVGFYTTASASSYAEISSVGTGYGSSPQWDPAVGLWLTNSGFGSFAAGTTHTLDQFTAEAAIAYPSLTLGLLALFSAVGSVDYSDLYLNGVQYIFTPTPVATAPTTITTTALASTGLTVTTTGFLPNEANIGVYISLPNGTGGPIADLVADANGAISYTYIATSPAEAGAYQLVFVGSVPNAQFFAFAAVAALPNMGVDATTPIIAASALLLGGAALAVIATKRGKRA